MGDEYVLYLRKSVGRAGIARQRTTTTAHVERLGGHVVGEFKDTDATAYRHVGGERPERPDFDAMIALVRARPGLRIAAWHADRLIRSGGDAELVIESGMPVVETLRGGTYDLSTATGRKHFRGDAIEAGFEVDHAIERMLEAQVELAHAGEWAGGPRPFGYSKDGMRLRQAEADALASGTAQVLAGVSLGEIARQWNKAGLRSTRGNTFTQGQVRRVLRRPRNAGYAVYRREIVGDAKWPAAVDRDLWHGMIAMLDNPARFGGQSATRVHLLSGLLTCGECKGPMTSHGTGGKGRKSRLVYACNRFRHVARAVDSLDDYVSAMVILRMGQDDAAEALAPVPAGETTRIQAELARLRQRSRQAADDYGDDKLDGDQVAIVNAKIKADRAALTARLADITRQNALAGFGASADTGAVWDAMNLAQRRAMIGALVRVTVNKAPRGRSAGWRVGMPYFDPESVVLEWM